MLVGFQSMIMTIFSSPSSSYKVSMWCWLLRPKLCLPGPKLFMFFLPQFEKCWIQKQSITCNEATQVWICNSNWDEVDCVAILRCHNLDVAWIHCDCRLPFNSQHLFAVLFRSFWLAPGQMNSSPATRVTATSSSESDFVWFVWSSFSDD